MLSPDEVKTFYDRFGARQDSQSFYEDCALHELEVHGRFGEAHSIFEFGCGTGRWAERLLAEELPANCRYLGIDISETMVDLARARLAAWRGRAELRLGDGSVTAPLADGACDRFLATYVFDLLNEDAIRALLAEAHRVLIPGGLLCTASLAHGQTMLTRMVSRAWQGVHSARPALVGGCRPIALQDYLVSDGWRVTHSALVSRYAITSEAMIAVRHAGS